MKRLKFDFSEIKTDVQILKVIEEIGELLQSLKHGTNIKEEVVDVFIASYGIIRTMYNEEETNKIISTGIEKVNLRLKK